MARRNRISEQNERFKALKTQAEEDTPGVLALVAITVEDLADANDATKEQLVLHCGQPAEKAHPAPAAPAADQEANPPSGLTPKENYKLKIMEHRAKIAATVSAAIVAVLAFIVNGGKF